MTRAALIGATGRMGAAIVRASVAGKLLDVVLAAASPGSKSTGFDIGEVAGIAPLGVRVVGELPPDLARAEVAIDFSRPELSLRALKTLVVFHDILLKRGTDFRIFSLARDFLPSLETAG